MSLNNFIPNLWSGRILGHLLKDHVYAKCFNRDYEGEIKGVGSSVKINSVGDITIGNYTRNTDLSAPEAIDAAGQILQITEGKTFHFYIDNLDKAQAKGGGGIMDEAMKRASWRLAEAVDTFLAGKLNAAVAAANILTPTTVGTAAGETDAYATLVQLAVALDKANVPETDRYVVVPPWYSGMLSLDPRVSSFGTPANRETYRGDPIGRAAGFTVYKSNNVPSSTDIIAGYKGAATFAETMDKVEPYSPEKRFGDAVKALHVYGALVTRPDGLAKIVATEGTF